MKYSLLFSFAILLSNTLSYAGMPVPLILKPNEEFLYEGSVDDTVSCGGKTFNSHNFSINVVQDSKPCNCSEDPPKKVYIDGLLAGVCTKEVKFTKVDDYPYSFINFALLDNFSDDEVIRLFSQQVGSCQLLGKNLENPTKNNSKDLREIFQAYKLEASITLKSKEDSPQVIANSLRETVKSGLCGTYSKSTIEKNKENSNRALGRADVGYEYFKGQGLDAQALLKMHYPASRFKDAKISLQNFKDEGYSPFELKTSLGASAKDLKDVGYKLSDLANTYNVKDLKDVFQFKELKNHYSTYALKTGGFTATELKDGGVRLDELRDATYSSSDLKKIFPATEFKKYYSTYAMKQVGFTASELKAVGVTLSELRDASYPSSELKNTFSAVEFKKYYSTYAMKQAGFTASELKTAGVSLGELRDANFSSSELKNTFSAVDFKKYYSTYAMKQAGFNANELKNAGVTLGELKNATYDSNELKKEFPAEEFKKYYSTYEMKKIGFTVPELKSAGVTLSELDSAGYDRLELKANYELYELKKVYNDYHLKQIGFTDEQIKNN